MSATIREELHQQIDRLPDHIVEKIANFSRLISPDPNNISEYTNWQDEDWQKFSLEQFFKEEDEIDGNKAPWAKLKYKKYTGWAFSHYLSKEAPK